MKITLTDENGKSIQLNIADEEYSKLFSAVKKTGYERVNSDEEFYLPANDGTIISYHDNSHDIDNELYNVANYYSDKTVAKNNTKADRLMRQLRRFAVEHRKKELDWESDRSNKFKIGFNHDKEDMYIDNNLSMQIYGAIYFDTKETAQLAIDTFKHELLWYFTEYKDSL